MIDRAYYRKRFADYPEVVTLTQFRKMLGGIADGTARKLLRENTVKHYYIRGTYLVPKEWVISHWLSTHYAKYTGGLWLPRQMFGYVHIKLCRLIRIHILEAWVLSCSFCSSDRNPIFRDSFLHGHLHNNFIDSHGSASSAARFMRIFRGQDDVIAGTHKHGTGESGLMIKLDIIGLVIGDLGHQALSVDHADQLLTVDHVLHIEVVDMGLEIQFGGREGGVALDASTDTILQLVPALSQPSQVGALQKSECGLKFGSGKVILDRKSVV